MTPREFFNAWEGWSEMEVERMEATRNITYGAAKWNAMQTAWSKEQARSIKDTPFPWENPPTKRTPEENKKRIDAKLRSWQNAG